MTPEKRKFNKVVKARKRRLSFLRSKGIKVSSKFDMSKFINSLPKQQPKEKESIFQRVKNKIF